MLAAHSLSRLPFGASCGIEEEYRFNREGEGGKKKEKEGGSGGVRVVLAGMGFNRENVWTSKRKWV